MAVRRETIGKDSVQLSVAVTVGNATLPELIPEQEAVFTMMSTPQLMVGGVWSVTAILRTQVAVLPEASVARQVTATVPLEVVSVCGKVGDKIVRVGVAGQLSDTVGNVSIAEVMVALQPVVVGKFCVPARQVIVGAVFSLTSIVKTQVLLFAGEALSNTVYCRVVTPTGKVPVRAAGVPLKTGAIAPVVLTTVGALTVVGKVQSIPVMSAQEVGTPVQDAVTTICDKPRQLIIGPC